MLSGSR